MNRRRTTAAVTLVLISVCTACGVRQSETTSGDLPSDAWPSVSAAEPGRDEAETNTSDAVAAAAGFVVSGQRLLDTPATRIAEVVRSQWSAKAADDAVTATVENLALLHDRLEAGTGPTRFRQSVLATRIDRASDASVTVSVWWLGILSHEGAVEPQTEWTTSSITLVLEDDRWLVESETSEPGPSPDENSDAEPLSHAELERDLIGFVDWEANR